MKIKISKGSILMNQITSFYTSKEFMDYFKSLAAKHPEIRLIYDDNNQTDWIPCERWSSVLFPVIYSAVFNDIEIHGEEESLLLCGENMCMYFPCVPFVGVEVIKETGGDYLALFDLFVTDDCDNEKDVFTPLCCYYYTIVARTDRYCEYDSRISSGINERKHCDLLTKYGINTDEYNII